MGRYAVKALKKAESALHRGGYVMNTGAAFPPDFRPWPRTSGGIVKLSENACGAVDVNGE